MPDPRLLSLMGATVRLYAPNSTPNVYGDSSVGSTYVTVQCHLRAHRRVIFTADDETAVASGTAWLASVVSGLDDRWEIDVPDSAQPGGWRRSHVVSVMNSYSEDGSIDSQAVHFGERRKGSVAGGQIF